MGITILNAIFYIPLIIFIVYFFSKRLQYKNRKNAGAFFFENNCLVLNTGIPYPIPFDMIERVELHYSSKELECRYSYGLWVKVFKKDGHTKHTFYKGYRTANLALPSDMEAALKEKGINCIMIDK